MLRKFTILNVIKCGSECPLNMCLNLKKELARENEIGEFILIPFFGGFFMITLLSMFLKYNKGKTFSSAFNRS